MLKHGCVYISCVLCFQSGGGREGSMTPSPEMVVSGGHQIDWTWQMEIVSKPIFFIVLNAGVK